MFIKHPAIREHTPRYGMCFTPAILIGTAMSAIGAFSQGVAIKDQADLQAEILRQQAETERAQAGAREGDFRVNQSRLMAARRAALGASGVDPATGSPLLASEDFAGEAELQALRIRHGGEVRATRLEQQARLERFAGRAARFGGFLRSGSLLLTGVGKEFA